MINMAETKLVKIHSDTKLMLDKLKIHPRETYDDVIVRLINHYREVMINE